MPKKHPHPTIRIEKENSPSVPEWKPYVEISYDLVMTGLSKH
jgi:hypothetical protein